MNEIKQLRCKIEDELGIDVNLVTSNSYTYLFEVQKKKGDKAFRKSSRRFKSVFVKKGRISFTLNELTGLTTDYDNLMQEY